MSPPDAVLPAAQADEEGRWELAEPLADPRGRQVHVAVHDPVRDRMLVIGGSTCPNDLNDVWALPLEGDARWTQLFPEGIPGPALSAASAIYDPLRDRVILFGGCCDAYGAINEVWALNLSPVPRWEKILPAGELPDRRQYHTAIYDPVRDRMIVYGGFDQLSGAHADTWALSLSDVPTWTRLADAASGPGIVWSGPSIYDPGADRMILFGGSTVDEAVNQTWSLTLSGPPTWAEIVTSGVRPSPRWRPVAVYDPDPARLVVMGGFDSAQTYKNDVWTLSLDGAPTWVQISAQGAQPLPRYAHSAIYDPRADDLIIFGGSVGTGCGSNDTWALTLDAAPTWTLLAPAILEPITPRYGSAMIYDPPRHRLVVFGGTVFDGNHTCLYGCNRGDTWAFSLDDPPAWTPLAVVGPAARYSATTVYDAARQRMLLFGGVTEVSCGEPCEKENNDVWAFDLTGQTSWGQLFPAGGPPAPRRDQAGIYDSVRDRFLLFGGRANTGSYTGDVWALSLGGTPTWTPLTPGNPGPGTWIEMTAVYDAPRDRIIFYGGEMNQVGVLVSETWALSLTDPPMWTHLQPTGPVPTPRRYHAAVYDAPRERMVIFGGRYCDRDSCFLNDTWALSLAGPPAWQELGPAGPLPSERELPAGAYDLDRARLLIFGGQRILTNYNDVWSLAWDTGTAAEVGPAMVTASADAVRLTWQLRGEIPTSVTVYRREAAGAWVPRGAPSVEPAGTVVFIDQDVRAGSRYGYALGSVGGAVLQLEGETEVAVPFASGFAVEVRGPNPLLGRRPLALELELPTGTGAEVAVYDAAGHRVTGTTVAVEGPARRALNVALPRRLKAGIYLLRVTAGRETIQRKLVLLAVP